MNGSTDSTMQEFRKQQLLWRMNPYSSKSMQGFTLIEVMIVVAILGVLAAIAYPSYTTYLQRGHRAEARGALLQAAQWMERVATANGSYPITTIAAQKTAIDSLQTQLGTGKYTITIRSTDPTRFVVLATPQGSQMTDACGTLTLNHAGQRGVENQPLGSSATATDCWAK